MSLNPNERRTSWSDRRKYIHADKNLQRYMPTEDSPYSKHVIQAAQAIIKIIHPDQRDWSGWNGINNPEHGNMYNSLVAPERMNPIFFLKGLIDQASKGGPNLWKRTKDSLHDEDTTWDGKGHEAVLTSNSGEFYRYKPVLGNILDKIEERHVHNPSGKDIYDDYLVTRYLHAIEDILRVELKMPRRMETLEFKALVATGHK